MRLINRVFKNIKRLLASRSFGLRFVRASTFDLPEVIKHRGVTYQLSLPKNLDNFVAFIDIFLDDVYQINFIRKEDEAIKTIVDVGAHSGLFSLYASMMVPEAEVLAFEPNKQLIPHLDHHSKLGHFQYNSAAVGSKAGKVTLIEDKDSSVKNYTRYDDEGSIDVLTIPDIKKKYGIETIDILKLDCEGAEWDILSDSNALQNIRWITMEYHTTANHTVEDMIRLLQRGNFSVLKYSAQGPTWGLLLARKVTATPAPIFCAPPHGWEKHIKPRF